MKIRIYQVNIDRDEEHLAFMCLDFMRQKQTSQDPDAARYDLVFTGEVECKGLEDVFSMFNTRHPAGYRARSLSVSDVVEVVEDNELYPGFYYCDNVGFEQVSFDPTKAQVSELFSELGEMENEKEME